MTDAAPISALFPDAVPPQRGEETGRAYARKRVRKSYSVVEMNQARRIIDHWNRTFAGVAGGKRANPADACNIDACVRLFRLRDKSEGVFCFDESDVCAAIVSYRNDRDNQRNQKWTYLSTWLTCESVDARMSEARRSEHAKSQPAVAKAIKSKQTDAAAAVVKHRMLADYAVHAAKLKKPFAAYVAEALRDPKLPAGIREECEQILALIDRRKALSAGEQMDLSNRARNVFDAYYHRAAFSPEDLARLNGIELALLDLGFPKRLTGGAK